MAYILTLVISSASFLHAQAQTQYTMPEGERAVDLDDAATAVPSYRSTVPQDTCEMSYGALRVENVSWPVEDPSEYRPELAPGGNLESLGKDVKEYRVYYEVE